MTLQERIDSFKELEKNWDSYGADPLSARTIELAHKVAELLNFPAQAAPGSDGSVSFEWHTKDSDLIISVDPISDIDNTFSFYIHIDGLDWECTHT